MKIRNQWIFKSFSDVIWDIINLFILLYHKYIIQDISY